eukprot:TRINITY_DN4725_c1_g2_i1.p1 TRINITY_DN4725_c1_g2~~TRINITY_DN4725_c1_g2_i1.p1  ORF type:complete len:490 (+),score=161.85 TRINITY_DN4725_c1_g2_i1:27-1472(+)
MDASPTASTEDEGGDEATDDDVHSVRTEIVRKLLLTERAYNNDLSKLVQIVMRRMLASPEVISEAEVKAVFANLKVIRGYNMLLLSELQERLAQWHPTQRVADIFVKMAVFFKTYTQFTDGLDRRREAFGIMRLERPKLNELCTEIEADEGMDKKQIYSLLLLPRRRIHEYCLLLEQLDRHTPYTHKDKANITQGLETLHDLEQYMQDSNDRATTVDTFASIQLRLTGKKSNKLALVMPGRELLREDKMWKLKGGKMSERRVYLFSDILLITKPPKSKHKEQKKEHVMHAAPLTECSISPFRVDGEMRGVNVSIGGEELCLYEGTPGDGEVWFIVMVEALVNANEERRRLASPRGIAASPSVDTTSVVQKPAMARTTSWSSLKRHLAQGRSKTPRGTSTGDMQHHASAPSSARGPRSEAGVERAHFSGTILEEEEAAAAGAGPVDYRTDADEDKASVFSRSISKTELRLNKRKSAPTSRKR